MVARIANHRRDAAFGVVAVAAYLGGALWARYISIPGPALVWFPPAGIAIACLYLRPRILPALVLAEMFSTRVIMGLGHEYGVLPLTLNAVGIVGAYGLAAAAMRRLRLDPRLRSSDDLVILAFGCLVVGAPIAAVLGVLIQVWIGLSSWDTFARSLSTFWVGDVVAVACLTPWIVMGGAAFLAGRPLPLADDERTTPKWLLLGEYLLPCVGAVWLMGVGEPPMRFVYFAFVPVVGLAIRHGVAAAALSSAALGAVISAGAHVAIEDASARTDVQLLLVMLTLTGLIVGAVVSA
ncbi:MAG: MASE1 domain-containing protein, partial [Aquihabitans sp.]